MTYAINAWLDISHPQVSIFDKQSGTEMLCFEGEELQELLDSGDLCVADLYSNNSQILTGVIRELALQRCVLDNSYTC